MAPGSFTETSLLGEESAVRCDGGSGGVQHQTAWAHSSRMPRRRPRGSAVAVGIASVAPEQ